MEQQDVQRIDDALSLVSGVFHQNSFGGGFGIITLSAVLVPIPI